MILKCICLQAVRSTINRYIFSARVFLVFRQGGLLTANRKSMLGKWLHAMPEQIYGKELKLLIQQGRIKLHKRTEKIVDQKVYFQNDGSPIHIDNIIWATGFRRDDHWIDIEAAFKDGYIDHIEGVSVVKGLYFVGLPWQTSRGSALLGWVKYDAQRIVEHLLRE